MDRAAMAVIALMQAGDLRLSLRIEYSNIAFFIQIMVLSACHLTLIRPYDILYSIE